MASSATEPEPLQLWTLISDYFDDNEDPSPRHVLFLVKEWAQEHPSETRHWLDLPDAIGPKTLGEAVNRHYIQGDSASGRSWTDATGADQPARTILPGKGY